MKTRKTTAPEWLGSLKTSCPPPIALITALVVLVGTEVIWLGTTILFDFEFFSLQDEILLFRDGLIVALAMLYGVYRVLWFHPIVYSDYLNWLKQTPWQKGVPLPLGPVRLCFWDAVLLIIPVLLLLDGRIVSLEGISRPSPATPVAAFLMGYVLSLVTVIWLSDQRSIAYVAFALQALVIGFSEWPIVSIGFLLASLLTATAGLSAGWSEFPWDDVREARKSWKRRFQSGSVKSGQLMAENDSPDKIPAAELGWPFSACAPVPKSVGLDKFEKCQIVGLLGIWGLCLSQLDIHEEAFAVGYGMLLFYMTGGVFLIRLAMTFAQHAPPISLAGRLATRRFIIPKYDAAILAAIVVVLVPAVMGLVSEWFLEWPLRWTGPAIMTCTLWTHILIGPNVDSWKLTAPSRLTPGTLNKRAFDQLT